MAADVQMNALVKTAVSDHSRFGFVPSDNLESETCGVIQNDVAQAVPRLPQ